MEEGGRREEEEEEEGGSSVSGKAVSPFTVISSVHTCSILSRWVAFSGVITLKSDHINPIIHPIGNSLKKQKPCTNV